LENLDDDVDISGAWESITEAIKASAMESIGYYELKQHEPWFEKECSEFLDQGSRLNCSGSRIQAKQMEIM
jgi:hypothetical protein